MLGVPMSSPRIKAISLGLGVVFGYLVELPGAAWSDGTPGFEICKVIADDQARLDCLKKLLAPPPTPDAGPMHDSWPLIVTHRPAGGRDAVAIMRTADTARSDPDLAGLMIRCAEKPGLEVLLAVVRPFPPRAKRDIVIDTGTSQSVLHAEVSSLGTGFVLPVEGNAFTTGSWQTLKELAVSIKDPEGEIHGVIRLDGIVPAMSKLSASCPPA